jgi:hypothetical protein
VKRLLLRTGVVVILLVAAVYSSAWFWGRGARTLFSPDTLECKSQSEILLTPEIPLYRSSFEYFRYDLVQFLIDKGYWTPKYPNNPRWIWIYDWNKAHSLGYGPLARQLSRNREFWMEWTDNNPAFAKVLWPKVLSQLRSGKDSGYVGEMIRCAQSAESLEAFEQLVATTPEFQ